ncbi:hypothetical protein TSUD_366520 [Trifolium subterraneum]|uniref:HXXXD-type acyl-transferase family protein n=1 Tax=Trifolium subterraneum TaxID=3900 RepID=A0A2Z6LKY5_TRISU|nr:hypothetical protein TSUD_366520 [Trifolium subterraneum]
MCNNEGALFVHAIAKNISVADILGPSYHSPIIPSCFALNGVKNYEGTSQPLLAVQVTELVDGIFIGFTINHVIVDGVRHRLVPPLQENYFGNAVLDCVVTMQAGDLLEDIGLGKGSWEMNKMIALYSNEKLKNHYENWLITPSFITLSVANSNSIVIANSPLFDVYGNDFGWGIPVGVRSGGANKRNGKIIVYAGVEKGSMDLEVCLPYEILEAIGNDDEFMEFVSN